MNLPVGYTKQPDSSFKSLIADILEIVLGIETGVSSIMEFSVSQSLIELRGLEGTPIKFFCNNCFECENVILIKRFRRNLHVSSYDSSPEILFEELPQVDGERRYFALRCASKAARIKIDSLTLAVEVLDTDIKEQQRMVHEANYDGSKLAMAINRLMSFRDAIQGYIDNLEGLLQDRQVDQATAGDYTTCYDEIVETQNFPQ